ncbi:MAG: hypothetical protein MUO34_01985, partial [Ignavibacteriaceae bacterium]|nr:hypothetical protein [Ignavibacteriaceae bacterium]
MKKFLVFSSLLLLYSSLYFMLHLSSSSTVKTSKVVKPVQKRRKDNRCKATLNSGKRCRRKSDEGSDFCW